MIKIRPRKLVILLTIFAAAITLTGIVVVYIIRYKYKLDGSHGAIGIIGGPDGPTVIYLTGQSSIYQFIVTFALLAVAGIIYLLFTRKSAD
jgi:Na+-transporting methylmalonyl-CoA/oxaloacetate decarboxylase beta subunit